MKDKSFNLLKVSINQNVTICHGLTMKISNIKYIEEKTGKKVVNKLNAIDYLENRKELE